MYPIICKDQHILPQQQHHTAEILLKAQPTFSTTHLPSPAYKRVPSTAKLWPLLSRVKKLLKPLLHRQSPLFAVSCALSAPTAKPSIALESCWPSFCLARNNPTTIFLQTTTSERPAARWKFVSSAISRLTRRRA